MITNLKKLKSLLSLNLSEGIDEKLFDDFPLLASESFVDRINAEDPKDPLLLQILPQEIELQKTAGYSDDPLFEKDNTPVEGLIHKYHGRVLLLVTNACAINCRFCFRRHGGGRLPSLRDGDLELKPSWQKVFSYIKKDESIAEIILSGGDPLVLKSDELKEIMDRLANISHVKRIRVHSRIPIVAPKLAKLEPFQSKLPVVLVVHCNHPNEINDDVINCIALFKKHNITVFNQTVLLRGINDDSEILKHLSEKLFNAGIIPYYLHILDKVQGAAHFYVGAQEAKEIHQELQENLPGYLVPKLVVDGKSRKRFL